MIVVRLRWDFVLSSFPPVLLRNPRRSNARRTVHFLQYLVNRSLEYNQRHGMTTDEKHLEGGRCEGRDLKIKLLCISSSSQISFIEGSFLGIIRWELFGSVSWFNCLAKDHRLWINSSIIHSPIYLEDAAVFVFVLNISASINCHRQGQALHITSWTNTFMSHNKVAD